MATNDTLADIDAKARQFLHQGRYAEAEPLYRQSLMIREQELVPVHPLLVDNLNNLAFVLSEHGNYSEAVSFSERALDIIEQQLGSEHTEYAKGLSNLGVLLAEQGNYSGAEEALRRCHAIIKKNLGPDHPNVTKSLLNLASFLFNRGSYSEAEQLFRSNLLILKQQLGTEHLDVVEPLSNLAGCLCKLGNYADAEPLYQRSLMIRKKQLGPDHPNVAHALNNLATYFSHLGNYSEAEKLYRNSLDILEKRIGSDNPIVAEVLGNIASLCSISGDHTKAEYLLRRSLSILSDYFGPEDFEVAKSLRNLAGCLCMLEKYDEAEKLCRQSLIIMKRRVGPDHPEVAISQRCLANILKGLGNYAEAELLYRRSLATLLQQLGSDHPEVAKNLMCLARLFDKFKPKHTPCAILCAKRAINILQKVRKNVSNLNEKIYIQFFDTSLESFYSCLAVLLIKSDRYGEAEYVMGMLKEKERSELLRQDIPSDSPVKAVAWNSVEAPHIDKFDEISSNLYAMGKQISTLKQIKNRTLGQNNELAELEVELYKGYSELSEFIDNINDALPASDSNNVDNDSYKLINMTGIAPNSVAIFTVTAEDDFQTVMKTTNGHKPFPSEYTAVELTKKILELRILLSDKNEAEANSYSFLPLAQELYDIIVRPMEKELNDKGFESINWMLDGALRLLPLSALHDGKQFMLEKFSNVCITTISSNETIKHLPWNGLGMGVTQDHDGLGQLEAVKDELEGIICKDNSAGVLTGEILLDEAFTRDAMLSNLADNYKAVHFASHFVLDPVNETMSYLLLGDGTRIRMDELRELPQLFKDADLVTFSACSTGLGTTSAKGREVDGLGYLGELQGAKTVLATLWPVHDSSTSMLMQEFYRVRENGSSKAKALQKAQLAMLKGDLISEEGHDFTHPFFWSPFILIGNGG